MTPTHPQNGSATPEPTVWQRLRDPFPPDRIGQLPRSTKKDNPKGHCNECGGWHGLPAVHLDYVSHADVTDRLLSVDPLWTWEPVASDEHGLPLMVRDEHGHAIGLWIRLTVSGVTRLGYGSVEPAAFDAEKQLIGDALRNSAMRFGVALDLWRKDESKHSVSTGGHKKTRRLNVPEGVTPRTCPECADNLVVIHTDDKGSFVGHDKTKRDECKWRPAREDSARLLAACPDPDPLPKEPPAPPPPVDGMPLEELHAAARVRLNDLAQFDQDAARKVVTEHGWKEDSGEKAGKWIGTIEDSGALVRLISDLNEAIKTSPAPIP